MYHTHWTISFFFKYWTLGFIQVILHIFGNSFSFIPRKVKPYCKVSYHFINTLKDYGISKLFWEHQSLLVCAIYLPKFNVIYSNLNWNFLTSNIHLVFHGSDENNCASDSSTVLSSWIRHIITGMQNFVTLQTWKRENTSLTHAS